MSAKTSLNLLGNSDTAALIGIRPATLELWRVKGYGPKFRKIGRAVKYVEAEILEWLDGQTRTSTSQSANPASLSGIKTGGRA